MCDYFLTHDFCLILFVKHLFKVLDSRSRNNFFDLTPNFCYFFVFFDRNFGMVILQDSFKILAR